MRDFYNYYLIFSFSQNSKNLLLRILQEYLNLYARNYEGNQYCYSLGVRNKEDAINIRSAVERASKENRWIFK
jgi:hypothetical protein